MDPEILENEDDLENKNPNEEEEEPEVPEKKESDSILKSVKKLLGVNEMDDFDQDIIIHINSAISILRQLGVGSNKGFIITGEDETYSDYLGENSEEESMVKLYLYYKTRIGFDPPTSGAASSQIEQAIKELEWRLNIQVDPRETFELFDGLGIPPDDEESW